MSQKEMSKLEQIRRLPERAQERFLDMLDGALMVLDDYAPGGAVMMDTGTSAGGAGSHGSGGTESR